jgi:hypothetical protein
MAITNGYATLEELQRKLGRTVSDSDVHKTKLETSITNASRLIDQHTGSFFYTKTLTTEKLDCFAPSENGLQLKSNNRSIYTPAPIISISALLEDSNSLTVDDDFYVYKSIGKIERDGYKWTYERKGLSISGSIGYESTPGAINELCLEIASILSGLSITTVTDENAETIIDAVRYSIPRWVFTQLDKWIWANV